MKRTLLLLLTTLFLLPIVRSQELSSFADIIQIMEESDLTYSINSMKGRIEAPDRSDVLNFNNKYRVIVDGQYDVRSFELSPEAKEYFDKAEKYFSEGNTSAARRNYMKVLEIQPGYYKVMTYVAQTWGMEGELDRAVEWYQQAIDKNYIDYLAHWLLADIYKMQGEKKKALDEISIAIVLNRNNPRLKTLFDEIYEMNKLESPDWYFTPQMELDRELNGTVNITANGDWLGYAMIKAVWMYEPGYRSSKGLDKNTLSTLEERECFQGLVVSLGKKKVLKKNPELKALKQALDEGRLNEFIFFEVMLPDHPYAAYQLDEDFIVEIAEYVKSVRGGK